MYRIVKEQYKQTAKGRRDRLRAEGRCPRCGEFSYPYYYCYKHRVDANIYRCLNYLEKKGWVKVTIDEKKKKMFQWDESAPIKLRNYSPEAVAKMQLPRLKGKPMTDDVVGDTILKVLTENSIFLTVKEIEAGVKSLKTIGKIIPETEKLVYEYKLIKEKKSQLTKSQRVGVEARIAFLIQRGVVKEDQLVI